MISPFARPMSVAEAHELAAALKAVADPARLRIVSLLAAAEPLSVAELTDRVWLMQTTVSHHLRILRRGGLIQREEPRAAGGMFAGSANRLDRAAFADLAGLLIPPKGALWRPHCPVTDGPCPGDERGAICGRPCQAVT